jgi:hypothetical protein
VFVCERVQQCARECAQYGWTQPSNRSCADPRFAREGPRQSPSAAHPTTTQRSLQPVDAPVVPHTVGTNGRWACRIARCMLQASHRCVVCCTLGVACCILHVARRTLLNLAHCLMLRRVLCVALCTSDAVSEVARCTPPLACCIFRVVRCTPPGRSASTRHVASTWTGCRRRRSRRPNTSSGSSTSAPTTAPPPPPTYAIARVVRRATRGRATDFGRTDYSQRVVRAYT